MCRTLVVIGPPVLTTEVERPARDLELAARGHARHPVLAEPARQRHGLRHRLHVLQLVLDDDPDDELVGFRNGLQRRGADLVQIRPGLVRLPGGKLRALGPPVRERVVAVVVVARQEPELLEVPDVGEIPDERRLQLRDLRCQLLVRERLEQRYGARPRVLERRYELRRRHRARPTG